MNCPHGTSRSTKGQRQKTILGYQTVRCSVKYPKKGFSRTCCAQPLSFWFVKKSRKNICFHQELFLAFHSFFFPRLYGDRSDRNLRNVDDLYTDTRQVVPL